jgi:hypothetical protein
MKIEDSEAREFLISQVELLWIAQKTLARASSFSFNAKGHSMTPCIRDGDRVTLARSEAIQIGDVILGRSGSRVLLHRVVATSPLGAITRGDAQLVADNEFMLFEDIVGRAVSLRGRKTVFLLHQPWSYIFARGGAFLVRRARQIRFLSFCYRLLAFRLK